METHTLASDVRHVVECSLKVIADLGGLEPGGYGSSSCDGEEYAGDECQKVRPSFCRQFVGESLPVVPNSSTVPGSKRTLWFMETLLLTARLSPMPAESQTAQARDRMGTAALDKFATKNL